MTHEKTFFRIFMHINLFVIVDEIFIEIIEFKYSIYVSVSVSKTKKSFL